jgi:hypothetical protein
MLRWLDQEEIVSERGSNGEEEKKLVKMDGLEGRVIDHKGSELRKVH